MTTPSSNIAGYVLFGVTLTGLLALVLNEVFRLIPAAGPLGEMQAIYAVDTTSQFALLVIAVATAALTKLVGWLRRRGSAER